MKEEENLSVDYPSKKDCPIEKQSRKRKPKKEIRYFRVFYADVLSRDLKAKSEKEAIDKFCKEWEISNTSRIKVKEIDREDFEPFE